MSAPKSSASELAIVLVAVIVRRLDVPGGTNGNLNRAVEVEGVVEVIVIVANWMDDQPCSPM